VIIGGIVYEDRSILINLAGYRHLDVILIIIALSVLVMICAIAIASRGATKGLLELAHSVKHITDNGRLEEVQLNDRGYEAGILAESINSMISTISKQFEEIKTKDLKIESVTLKEPVELKLDQMAHSIDEMFPEFIGSGTAMIQMKRDIVKASQVDVDVLIEGETGTGKQLAAEAVHRLSQRAGEPFMSINCGELDENLLLDSLFGHVKGAFTDSRTDRKGAFLEANGGTLFLDEIQSASPKVQQALLRALSMRKIKQLGSDKDVDVDVRLITATNVDLKKLISTGNFREDLYYRLKVVTIQTPALRDQRQIIPSLVLHFLKEGERMAGRSGLSISRGALNVLVAYSWPGNIRELKHLIITAAVMAEGNVIQAEQLDLDLQEHLANEPPLKTLELAPPLPSQKKDLAEEDWKAADSGPIGAGPTNLENAPSLNARQTAAYEHILLHGSISSTELIEILRGSISKRTAGYDIQAMVRMGLLIKTGRGPTTRYILCRREQKG
jgi:DNA-binding NtrC family response regulator